MPLGLTPLSEPAQAITGDAFNENRVSLGHLSPSVASMADLEAALALFEARGVPHGEINSLTPFGIALLALRDPGNIQVELTAPPTA